MSDPNDPNDLWLQTLAAKCKHSSQSRVAARLGVSPAMVNQALAAKYKGDMDRLRLLVEGAFMDRKVDCPVLGEIGRDDCIGHQERPYAATNWQRVRLFRACRDGCRYYLIGGSNADTD